MILLFSPINLPGIYAVCAGDIKSLITVFNLLVNADDIILKSTFNNDRYWPPSFYGILKSFALFRYKSNNYECGHVVAGSTQAFHRSSGPTQVNRGQLRSNEVNDLCRLFRILCLLLSKVI